MTRLTGRGAGTLAAGVLLTALGLVAGHPLVLALGAIALGAVVAAAVVSARPPGVRVVRELFRDRVERGGRAGLTLRVHNPGPRRQAGFTAVDRAGGHELTIAVRSLAPGAEQSYVNELPTGRRGRHQVGPLRLRRSDVLGLGRCELQLGGAAALWVYPRTHPVRSVAGGLPLHHHDGAATEDSPRGSLDVREVREYVPGDEVRHLHWKATARTGRLMVRDCADPHQPRFTVLLDDRGGAAEPDFEEAVELAASLVVAAVREGHRCRLVASGGLDVGTGSGSGDAVRRLLDELCLVRRAGEPGEPLVPAAPARADGGVLVVVSPVASAADRAALAALRPRYADVVVVALGGSAPVVPGVRVLSAVDAADAALRWQAVVAR